MSAYKIWRLGEYRTKNGHQLPTQEIDHVWQGNPITLQTMASCSHYGKMEIYGDDCVEVATRLVAMLNAADALLREPDLSDKAQQDRRIIRSMMKDMGSMATANLYHILGLNYGTFGFEDAIDSASRVQLDKMLAKCGPYRPSGEIE